jgi:fido (protein-threonine AMPylation protein)
VEYIKKNQKCSKFFLYGSQLKNIEEHKITFQIFLKLISEKKRVEIMEEFLRTFLVNSMAMEGGTISYELARAIDEKKKIRIENINKLDVPLYTQLKKAFYHLQSMRLRYPKQISDLHKEIYQGIYPFAGNYRRKKVTFGDLKGLAVTVDSKDIVHKYKKALNSFYSGKNKTYGFERVIAFHSDFQQVHGFEDGNSRLGRLIMVSQLLQLGYPPLLVKGTKSTGYRRTLVKSINERDNISLLKFFYDSYRKTFSRFWMPVLLEK